MVYFLIVLALVFGLLQRYITRHGLQNVYYDCHTSKDLLDPDEDFEIISVVENRKWLPLSFVRLEEIFPKSIELDVDEEDIDCKDGRICLNTRFYLLPRQAFRKTVRAKLPSRGSYFFRFARIYGGDYLGITDEERSCLTSNEVVVMPKALRSKELGQTLGDYMGDVSVSRFILEDPILTVGCREYTGTEPMRAVNWRQTARTGKLMVKEYDHTLDLAVTILLNIKTDKYTAESEEQIERCFSVVRFVCEELEKRKVKYRFSTNAAINGFAGSWSELSDGLGDRHFNLLMESLGRATTVANHSAAWLIERAYLQSEQGRCFIVITPQMDAAFDEELQKLRKLTTIPVCVLTSDFVEDEEAEAL